MEIKFNEINMIMLMKQDKEIRAEFAKLGFVSTDEDIDWMLVLASKQMVNRKAINALKKIFKEKVEGGGYYLAVYQGIQEKNHKERKHEPVDGLRFYFWEVEETNGERTYFHKGVEALEDGLDPNEWLDERAKTTYDGGIEEDGYYWFCGEVACQAYDIKEISKEEFNTFSIYI